MDTAMDTANDLYELWMAHHGRALGAGPQYTDWNPCEQHPSFGVFIFFYVLEMLICFVAWLLIFSSAFKIVDLFAVASAVEHIDNDIIGDLEQEKEKEGDFRRLW